MIVALLCSPHDAGAAELSTIADASGTLVKVPTEVKRIVSLAPNLTEILFALGAGPMVVGVSSFSDFPPDATRLPKVGGFGQVSVEKIVSLSPDVVIATMDGNARADIDRLRSLGITVFCVFPNSIAELIRDMSQLGHLLSRQQAAKELTANIESVVKYVRARASSLTKRHGQPKVLLALDLAPIVTASGQTFIGQLVAIAGGANLAQNSSIRYPRLSLESVVAASPDVILLVGHGDEQSRIAELRQWERWSDIPAVKNGRVYSLNPDLVTRAGPRIAAGLMQIQEKLFAPAVPSEVVPTQ